MCPLVPLAFVGLRLPDWILPTLIGVVASFWVGRWFRLKSQMAYQSHDFTIVGEPSLGEIKILFNGAAVPRVVVTQLAVWNTGNTVVRRADSVPGNPLKVCFETGTVILDAQRVNATHEDNDFQIKISQEERSCASLDFEYLNPKDGAKFQIIHTGAKTKAKVTGSIKGIPKGVEDWGDLREWSEHKSRLGQFKPVAVVFASSMLLFLLGRLLPKNLSVRYPLIGTLGDWLAAGFFIMVGLVFASGILAFLYMIYRAATRSTPKSLSRG